VIDFLTPVVRGQTRLAFLVTFRETSLHAFRKINEIYEAWVLMLVKRNLGVGK
jgi:hypothetical protein